VKLLLELSSLARQEAMSTKKVAVKRIRNMIIDLIQATDFILYCSRRGYSNIVLGLLKV
jgi:hypothetical protein